jgi:hypothetical protein
VLLWIQESRGRKKRREQGWKPDPGSSLLVYPLVSLTLVKELNASEFPDFEDKPFHR